jgi:hypothetical protein
VVDGGISTQSGCSGIHDVVVLVLGQLIEIEGIFVDRCLETQGQFILRGVLNLQIFKKISINTIINLTTEYSLYCLTLNQNQFEQLISQKYFFLSFSFKKKLIFIQATSC